MPARTGTTTTELLGLHTSRVGDEERAVVRDELLLDLEGVVGVVELGKVCDEGAGDRLADSIDLGSVSTTLDTDSDIDGLELVLADHKYRLVDLVSQDLGLNELDGRAVDAEEATAFTRMGDRSGGLLRQ